MKRFIVYCAVLAAVAAIFTGCTNSKNVSDESNGIMESSSVRPSMSGMSPTVTTQATETEAATTQSEAFESSSETEEMNPGARGRSGGKIF